ncbi:MAG: hypothetical protein ABR591_07875 [Candidatus Velthaea sp.]
MNIIRFVAVAATLALAACGGGSSGNSLPPNSFGTCDPGTAVALARPAQGQAGVATSQNPIEIVASGNNNTLGTSFQSWDLILQPQFGASITSSPLSAAADPSGPHPFASDFFYSGSVSGLAFGTAYTVFLNSFASNCTPVAIGSFST